MSVENSKFKFCNQNIKNTDELQHFATCEQIPLGCPYICGSYVKRCELINHIQCYKRKSCCVFHNVGCSYVDTQENIANHMKDSLQEHILLLVREVCNLKIMNKDLLLKKDEILTKNTQMFERINSKNK